MGLHLIIYIRDCSFFTNKGLLAFLRSLTDEVHELVEFRSDDNLGATVAHLTNLTGIRLERIVLTTTTCSQTLRIYTIVVLQSLYDT